MPRIIDAYAWPGVRGGGTQPGYWCAGGGDCGCCHCCGWRSHSDCGWCCHSVAAAAVAAAATAARLVVRAVAERRARRPLRLLLLRPLPLRVRVLVSREAHVASTVPHQLAFRAECLSSSTGAWRSSPAARPGIGAELARQLSARGMRIGLIDRDAARLGAVVPGAETAVADVRDAAGLTAAIDDLAARLGGIDVVVANAGIATGGPLRMVGAGDGRGHDRHQPARRLAHGAGGDPARARAARAHPDDRLRRGGAARRGPRRLQRVEGGRRGARPLAAGRAQAARRVGRRRLLPVPEHADGHGRRGQPGPRRLQVADCRPRSPRPGRWSRRSRARSRRSRSARGRWPIRRSCAG